MRRALNSGQRSRCKGFTVRDELGAKAGAKEHGRRLSLWGGSLKYNADDVAAVAVKALGQAASVGGCTPPRPADCITSASRFRQNEIF